MNLNDLFGYFKRYRCTKLLIKELAANDNSKNQVYFGGSFSVLNIIPSGKIFKDTNGERKRNTFKSKLNFFWINTLGERNLAPNAQLILYPDYPEVRFSGFLLGCKDSPNEIMNSRDSGRILCLGINDQNEIYGFATAESSSISKQLKKIAESETNGVFKVLTFAKEEIVTDSKEILIEELRRIYKKGWIKSKRLLSSGLYVPCEASNCGGFTLEAELGVPANSKSEPDFLGWEVKNFSVKNFSSLNSSVLTLMDHSPDGGYFADKGVEAFIKKYGYKDKLGRESRMNFGGVHKIGLTHGSTKLRMDISHFDFTSHKIKSGDLAVALIDEKGNPAAEWSYQSFLEHWIKKHSKACYVPSILKMDKENKRNYQYGDQVLLCMNTDVNFFLRELVSGNVYFDPGIKLEMEIKDERKKSTKVRSLFRIKSGNLPLLYSKSERINL